MTKDIIVRRQPYRPPAHTCAGVPVFSRNRFSMGRIALPSSANTRDKMIRLCISQRRLEQDGGSLLPVGHPLYDDEQNRRFNGVKGPVKIL